jgi:hypothetical protein
VLISRNGDCKKHKMTKHFDGSSNFLTFIQGQIYLGSLINAFSLHLIPGTLSILPAQDQSMIPAHE